MKINDPLAYWRPTPAQSTIPDEVARDLVTIHSQAERISSDPQYFDVLPSVSVDVETTGSRLNCVARACVAMAGERVAALSVRIDADLAPELPPPSWEIAAGWKPCC